MVFIKKKNPLLSFLKNKNKTKQKKNKIIDKYQIRSII